MPISIKFLDVYNIIEIKYFGKVTGQELEESVEKGAALSIEKNSNLIIADCTELTDGHTVFDLYYLVPLFKKYKLRTDIKEAILSPKSPAMADHAAFFETLTVNNGFNTKTFKKREQAIDWLIRKE